MSIPESFTIAAISANVISNIVTEMLLHHAKKFDRTRLGRKILEAIGIREPTPYEQLREVLVRTLSMFFKRHPQYQLVGVMKFFVDPSVAEHLGVWIVEKGRVNYEQLGRAFDLAMGTEPISRLLLRQRGLDSRRLIDDFVNCYLDALHTEIDPRSLALAYVLLQHSGAMIDQLSEDIQSAVARMERQIAKLNDSLSGRKILYPVELTVLLSKCQRQIRNEITTLIGSKYVSSLFVNRTSYHALQSFVSKEPRDSIDVLRRAIRSVDEMLDAVRIDRAQAHSDLYSGVSDAVHLPAREREKYSRQVELKIERLDVLEQELLEAKEHLDRVIPELFGGGDSFRQAQYLLGNVLNSPACQGRIRELVESVQKSLRNCLLIIDAAGRGKTNLVCAAAVEIVKFQPVILVSGGTLVVEDNQSLVRYLKNSLRWADEVTCDAFMHQVEAIVEASGSELLVIVDGINENPDTRALKACLAHTISQYSGKRVKFIITCRDIYWRGYLHSPGDFWDNTIFQTVEIGDFTASEFQKARDLYFERYKLSAGMTDRAAGALRHPLLLRFFCEAYTNAPNYVDLGLIDDIRLKPLFDRYWQNKVEAVRHKGDHRTPRQIENFLLAIARKVRYQRTRTLDFEDITNISGLSDFEEKGSLYVRILDEGIILEQTPSVSNELNKPRVTFVYDEFMEYVIALDFLRRNLIPANIPQQRLRLRRILQASRRFNSLVGVVTYLLVMIEEMRIFDSLDAWVYVYNRGEHWHLALCRALSKVGVANLGDRAWFVAGKLARSASIVVRKEILLLAEEVALVSPNRAIGLFSILLADMNWEIRIVARNNLLVLGKLGNDKAIECLEKRLAHHHTDVKCCALYGLAAIGAVKEEFLPELFRSRNPYMREATVYAARTVLEERKTSAVAHEILRQGSIDTVCSVAELASQSLEDLASTKPPPDMVRRKHRLL